MTRRSPGLGCCRKWPTTAGGRRGGMRAGPAQGKRGGFGCFRKLPRASWKWAGKGLWAWLEYPESLRGFPQTEPKLGLRNRGGARVPGITFFGCFRNSPVVRGREEKARPPPVSSGFGCFRLLPAERAEGRRWWRPCWEQQVRRRLPVCRARSSAAEGRGGARQAAGCGGRE